jgi:hypothetical protein
MGGFHLIGILKDSPGPSAVRVLTGTPLEIRAAEDTGESLRIQMD